MADPEEEPMFAQVADLEARGIEYENKDQAEQLIKDASGILVDEMPAAVARARAATLTRIVCNMIQRALDDPGDMAFPFAGPGFESLQTSVGPFQHSARKFNPSDNLYISKSDRRQLRGGQRAFMVNTMPPDAGADYV